MGSPAWYVGMAVAFAAVLAVVICVAAILNLARRISVQARELAVALHATAGNTDILQAIPAVNDQIVTAYAGVNAVRTAVLERKLK